MEKQHAIIAYAKGCPSCKSFKATFEKNLLTMLSKHNISWDIQKAPSVQRGFDQKYDPIPKILRYITFYPCFILLPKGIFKHADKLPDDSVLDSMRIFIGTVSRSGQQPAIVPVRMTVPITIDENTFESFILGEDVSTPVTVKKEKPRGLMMERPGVVRISNTKTTTSAVLTGGRSGKQTISTCGGVVPIINHTK